MMRGDLSKIFIDINFKVLNNAQKATGTDMKFVAAAAANNRCMMIA
jgi:hypothetical protein